MMFITNVIMFIIISSITVHYSHHDVNDSNTLGEAVKKASFGTAKSPARQWALNAFCLLSG